MKFDRESFAAERLIRFNDLCLNASTVNVSEGILDAVSRGVDLFDCVLPTRIARHGKALTRDGDLSMKRVEWLEDSSPLEEDCPCVACRKYTRGYIRHLVNTHELLANRLLTLHNLTYTYRLMEDIRTTISDGSFAAFHEAVVARRST